jgi:hypothetical protein
MSSSRRGGTNKLLNHAGTSIKEMRASYAHLSYEEKEMRPLERASLF